MRALVVGGDGLIGAAVFANLVTEAKLLWAHQVMATTRKEPLEGWIFLDLLKPQDLRIPSHLDTVFLCAGINGFKECEQSPVSWRVNVDGILHVALMPHAWEFRVYISSQAVEWSNSAYARQRAQVEAVLMAKGSTAIVRPGRVNPGNVSECARQIVKIGMDRVSGVFHLEG